MDRTGRTYGKLTLCWSRSIPAPQGYDPKLVHNVGGDWYVYESVDNPSKDSCLGVTWTIECEPHVMIKLKRVFAKVHKGHTGLTPLADSDETCRDIEWFMSRYPLDVREDHLAYMRDRSRAHDTRTREFHSVLSGEIAPRRFEMEVPAREYQRVAAELALRSGGLLVADDMGLGKSATAICALTEPQTRPALVVTMTHLQTQWQREIRKFAPDLTSHIVSKSTAYDIAKEIRRKSVEKIKKNGVSNTVPCPTCDGTGCRTCAFSGEVPRGSRDERQMAWSSWVKKEPPFPDVVIMNYHKLSGWAGMLAPKIRSVVFDECQELRRRGSNKSIAAEHIGRSTDLRIGTSATPVYNYGGEMWNILDILRPDELGSKEEFVREWCAGAAFYSSGGDKAIIRDPKTFGAYVRESGFMIRRTRGEVGRELPSLQKIPHHIDSDPKELEKVKDSVAELAKIILTKGKFVDKGQAARELDWKLRQATGIGKAPFVAHFVRMLAESGQKVVLYGWHREVYSIWREKLNDMFPVFYTGKESPKQKDEARRKFIEGDSQLLIMSLRAGQGLDGLQGVCNTVVFGELDWSPAVHEQSIGRVYRDGQGDGCVAYFLVAEDGSDPVIADMLGIKQQQIEGIKDPSGDLVEDLVVDPDHVKRLASHFLGGRGIKVSEEKEGVDQ